MRWFNSFVALENKFFREMKAAHREIEKEIIRNLENLKVDEEGVLDLGRHKVGIDDLVDAENSVDAIEEIGWEMISDIFETAGERASKEIRDFVLEEDETKKAVTANFDYSFNINSPEAIKYIDSRSVEFARESMDTILQSLRTKWNAHLKTGIRSRVTIAELIEKIQEIFRGTERETWTRARLIARTETVGAANQASMMAYNDAGVPRKMWVSSRDPLVRDSHEKMDGVIVNSSENFIVNGMPMNGPGDPKGGPAETCNCRCFSDHQTPVFTDKGWVKIGKIKVGDKVLTHKGRFKKVTKIINTSKYSGYFVKVWIDAFASERMKHIGLTEDHPVMTDKGWVRASELKKGDLIKGMGLPCRFCGKPALLSSKGFCSRSCHSKNNTKEQGSRPEHREIVSRKNKINIIKQYEIGDRDRFAVIKNARKALFKKYGPGGFLGSHRLSIQKDLETALIKKYGSMLGFMKVASWKGLTNVNNGHPREKEMASMLDRENRNFMFQFPVGRRRVDFYVPEEKLFIEVDDFVHHGRIADKDLERDIEILKEYPDHKIGHYVFDSKSRFAPKWEYRSLESLNHDGVFQPLFVRVKKVVSWKARRPRMVYNFSVEGDETYVVKGMIFHNCTIIPIFSEEETRVTSE